MSKNLKKFKDGYLDELLSDDNRKEQLKSELGIIPTVHKEKNQFFTKYRRPLIFGGTAFVLVIAIIITVISVVGYINTPAYQGMLASNMRNSRLTLSGTMDGYDDMTEEIENQIGVVVDDQIICYANPNEEIVITVKIDNPKYFEILSFTLNGRLYQSYEFLDGSDSMQIKVKFTCQETSGMQIITIDAIKYVDGTQIKNARFEADRTIKVGITYQNIPEVSQVSEYNNTTSFGVSFVVTDPDSLINVETGLKIFLFDSEKLINVTNLRLGMNVIPYSNLRLGSDYAYIIIGVFDLFDGQGKRAYVLHQNSFTTEEGFTYKNIETTYDSIKIDYDTVSGFNGELDKIELFLDDDFIDSIDPSKEDTIFNNLKSDMEYTLKTTYKYTIIENNEEVLVYKDIQYVVKTKARPIPTVEFTNGLTTQTSIEFSYNIFDTTDLGKIIKVDVYLHGELVNSYDEDIRKFENLLSDNDYQFIVTYEYDLCDDTGKKTLTAENTYHTEPLAVPTASFDSSAPFYGMIYCWIRVTDVDNIINIIGIELYKDGVLVQSTDTINNYNQDTNNPGVYTGDYAFSGLEAGDYLLVIVYQYDLHDGTGVHTVDKDHPTADNKIGCTLS